jgi:hypothetical protein
MMYKRTPRVAWNDQKKSAIKRGIGWYFEFDDWVAWWEANLGKDWFSKRGHRTGQYVMARNGDCGPYARQNVRCVKVEANHNEYNLTKASQQGQVHRTSLPKEVVKQIYQADGLYSAIAKQFDLDVHSIHRIKCQKCYKQITDKLEKGCSR